MSVSISINEIFEIYPFKAPYTAEGELWIGSTVPFFPFSSFDVRWEIAFPQAGASLSEGFPQLSSNYVVVAQNWFDFFSLFFFPHVVPHEIQSHRWRHLSLFISGFNMLVRWVSAIRASASANIACVKLLLSINFISIIVIKGVRLKVWNVKRVQNKLVEGLQLLSETVIFALHFFSSVIFNS